jgi:hypothetical protein
LVEGTILNVHFEIESREFNGKWYTNLTALKVEIVGENQQPQQPQPIKDTFEPEMDAPVKDDLPF